MRLRRHDPEGSTHNGQTTEARRLATRNVTYGVRAYVVLLQVK
jgi:hypothetical protein